MKTNAIGQSLYYPLKNAIASQWNHHKVSILSVTALAAAVMVFVAIYRSKGCVDGFYDDWGCKKCEDGKWIWGECDPNYERYQKLIKSCMNGDTTPGCFKDSYYRELSLECKENPTAALCDGKYDHTEWVNKVNRWVSWENWASTPPIPKNV
jgi:hypothetical protein